MTGVLRGNIQVAREEPIGTELAADVLAGEEQIDVEDLSVLDWNGNTLLIGLEGHSYTIDGLPDPDNDDIDIDEDVQLDGGLVNLGSPLVNGYFEGDRVLLYPISYEKVAYVLLDEQQEVVRCRVPDPLWDRLATDTRTDATAETVEVHQINDEWVVSDIVGELGPGRSRGYVEADSVPVTGTLADPTVLLEVPIDIPTDQHRVVFWASAELYADVGTFLKIGFDDDGFDFLPGEFPLATFFGGGDDGSNAFTGPAYVAPALPLIDLAHAAGGGSGIPLPNGLVTGNVRSQYFPTTIAPYNLEPPTPGQHMFRLVAWIDSGAGAAHAETLRFWVAVL